MAKLARRLSWTFLSLVLLDVAGGQVPAQAPFDVQVLTLAASPLDRGNDEDEPEIAQLPERQAQLAPASKRIIEQMVFGTAAESKVAESRLDELLRMKVREIDLICHLSEAQKAKIGLAGRGEIKHFLDRFEAIRRACLEREDDQIRVRQAVLPLTVQYQSGLFGEKSFLGKSLAKVLTEEQARRYRQAEIDRQQSQHRSRVNSLVLTINQIVGLEPVQRQKLAELLSRETRPPRIQSPYNFQVILWQADRLPENTFKDVFTAAQWQLLTPQIDKVRRLEPLLRNQGYLPEETQTER